MSADPITRLPAAFGDVLYRRRNEGKRTVEAFAAATGLSATEITSMECGDYAPTLTEFFRLARALSEDPAILFVDVVAAWRSDSNDPFNKSRASDFTRLYRLGCYLKPGDFREQPRTYDSVSEAINVAVRLNEQRRTRRVGLLDYVCTYIRMDYLSFDSKPESGPPSRGDP